MAKKKQAEQTEKPIDFESALADVEKVVHQLESGELGLSESLVHYERGIQKIKQCHQVLENAERRIAVLTSVDEDGTAHLEPVDTNPARSGDHSPGLASKESGVASKKTESKSSGVEDSTPQPPKSRGKKRSPPPITDMDDHEGLF